MRSFTIIVCLLALFLAAFINADGITPRKARGKARSSLQGFHSKLWREHLKNPAIKKAENRGSRVENRVNEVRVYRPGQALKRAPQARISQAKMQKLAEEKELRLRKEKHGKQDGSRTSSITATTTSRQRITSREDALRQARALHEHKIVMLEKRVLEGLNQFCNQAGTKNYDQCKKILEEYDLENVRNEEGQIQIDREIKSKVRGKLHNAFEEQYRKKRVEIKKRFDNRGRKA